MVTGTRMPSLGPLGSCVPRTELEQPRIPQQHLPARSMRSPGSRSPDGLWRSGRRGDARAAQRPVLFPRVGALQDDGPADCYLNPDTVPVTHFGALTLGGSGVCPHARGISAVATSRSLAMSLSSQ